MPDTHTYHITRNCLKSGYMFLSPSAKSLFPREGHVQAKDTASNETLTLTLLDARIVTGLGPFYARHGLEPNDLVVITKEGESYTLTPTARPRLADYTRAEVQRRLVDRVVEQAPPVGAGDTRTFPRPAEWVRPEPRTCTRRSLA